MVVMPVDEKIVMALLRLCHGRMTRMHPLHIKAPLQVDARHACAIRQWSLEEWGTTSSQVKNWLMCSTIYPKKRECLKRQCIATARHAHSKVDA